MAVLRVLLALLCPPSIRKCRRISPLLLTLLLTIARASFLGCGCSILAWLLSKPPQPKLWDVTAPLVTCATGATNARMVTKHVLHRACRSVPESLYDVAQGVECFMRC